jgi:hypothetical protein
MSFDLFKLIWIPTEVGCCLKTGGKIELGATPLTITVEEVPGASTGHASLTPYPLVMKLEAGSAVSCSKEVLEWDVDKEQELRQAARLVTELHVDREWLTGQLRGANELAEDRLGVIEAYEQKVRLLEKPGWLGWLARSRAVRAAVRLVPEGLKKRILAVLDERADG